MPETQTEDSMVHQPGAVVAPGSISDQTQNSQPIPQNSAQTDSQTITATPPEAQSNQGETPVLLPSQPSVPDQSDGISWTASEYVGHQKNPTWYVAFAAVAVIIIGIVYAITRDITSAAALIVGTVVLAIYAGRPPKDQLYHIDDDGFSIGQKRYEFAQFRSYSTVEEGALVSIIFSPLKRFAPLTTIYFSPQQEDQIASYIENKLPYEDYKHDPIDRLMRQIRF
jgi:hypothetical protein